MNYIDAIKKSALLAVLKPDVAAWVRSIQRWFSKTFHMSLPEVEELPTEYILMHYFEDTYGLLEEDEREKQLILLTETPLERERRLEEERLEEEELMNIMRAEVEAQKAKEMAKELKSTKVLKPAIPVPDLPDIKINLVDEDTISFSMDTDNIPTRKK